MIRSWFVRVCLVATLGAGALALLGTAVDLQAQPPGWRIERTWKCRTCGGFLGNGVKPPPTCHHCEAKRAAAQSSGGSKEGLPTATVAVVGIGVFSAVGGALYFLNRKS